MLASRFLQYWGRIGSENNMTSCHRPVCRKEGVLLDYSTDGGTFQGLSHTLEQVPKSHPVPLTKVSANFADFAMRILKITERKLQISVALHVPYV